jgi:hypothetical protein
MNVSSSTYPAVVCLSPSIGSSQADPKLSLKGHGPYEQKPIAMSTII